MRLAVYRALLACALCLGLETASADFDEDYDSQSWQEIEPALPAAPRPESLHFFFVSPTNPNRHLLDLASISIGVDGVVRYVLVVETPGGARNVSFEGIRCATRERRIYALGRRDGSWSKSRNADWEGIRDISAYRQHAELFREYFCPGGLMVATPQQAADALRRGAATQRGAW